MALKDLYGIGKGTAQVFDMSDLSKFLAETRKENRDKAEKDLAKRATKAATLNALDDKLQIEGHSKHGVFLQERLDDVRNFATEMYGKYGEEVFVDNPDARAEWENKINDFKKYNQYSKNIKADLKAQIDRSKTTGNEMNAEDVKAFNEYLDLPLDEQMKRGLPYINERELSAVEEFDESSFSGLIDGVAKEYGYDTAPDESGDYKRISGVMIDKGKYEDLVNTILTNKNSPYYIAASREAIQEVRGANLIQEEIRDPQTGDMIPNPQFMDVVNQHIEANTRDLMDNYSPKTKVITSRQYDKRSDKTQEEETTFTPMGEEEGGFRFEEKLEFADYEVKNPETGEPTGETYKVSDYIADTYKSNTGKGYFKLAKNMWVKDGKMYAKEVEGGKKLDKNTVIDSSGNAPEKNEKLTPQRKVKTRKTGNWYSVKTGETADLSSVPYYINREGQKVKISGAEGFEKARITEYVEDAKYVESDGSIIFEDDPDFNKVATKDNTKTGPFIKIKGSKGKDFVTIPYTDEAKEKFPKAEAARPKAGAKYNKPESTEETSGGVGSKYN
jgi:hypothetical protein